MYFTDKELRQAACASANPEWFFPDEENPQVGYIAKAVEVCSKCPIAERCLQIALANEDIGIWGGTTFEQRVLMLNPHRAEPKELSPEKEARLRSLNKSRTITAASEKMDIFVSALSVLKNKMSEDIVTIVKARVDNPEMSLAEIAGVLNLTKDVVSGKLRRVEKAMKEVSSH